MLLFSVIISTFILPDFLKKPLFVLLINPVYLQLSIIIVSYNVKYFLEQCLASVQKAIEPLQAEVWVVDNASSDGSFDYLQHKFPWVKFIENAANAGFAKANNQALSLCSGAYILFLNPDTIIPEDALAKCIGFMETKSDAGALGIRMVDGSGIFLPESKRSSPSPMTSFYKLTGLSNIFPSSATFSRYSLSHLDQYKNHEVEVLAGAFMLVKKDLLAELKGFDEDFFMYGEDIDLSYRIQKSGYKNYYFSGSTIIHFKGESTGRKNLKYVKIFYQAMSIFVKKHYAGKSAFLFASFIHIAIWLRAGASATMQLGSKIKFYFINKNNTFRLSQKDNRQQKTAIAGTPEECEEVKNLLAKAGEERRITLVEMNEKNKNLGEAIAELQALAESGKITEVIFCQGSLSYSFIINEVQSLPNKIYKRFHAKGTESIVGSDSKNTSGEVIFAASPGN